MLKERLRIGFTTGSAAAAASKAAIIYFLSQRRLKIVDVPLPNGERFRIPISRVGINGNEVFAEVTKDAGDDPDVTDGALIKSYVRIERSDSTKVMIRGGKGVGVVTKPGLPLPIGEYAINPAPRRQIEESVKEALLEVNTNTTYHIFITIEVPEGEKIAKRTLNPKLGIVGGISILGTRGTVIPFSREAYMRSIEMEMDVAVAVAGKKSIVLCTGGRSQRFARRLYPELKEECFVQVADFFGFSLKEAKKRGFKHVIYSCFFGKLIKMAQGAFYTHAKDSKIDFDLVARWAASLGMEANEIEKIRRANTAMQVIDMVRSWDQGPIFLRYIMERAISSARQHLGPGPTLQYNLFSLNGELIYQISDESEGR